jgi:metallopeptidase MepB
VPLFREAIVLRDEAARLLGYPDHATLRIEDKMAKTPKTVFDFLGDLKTRLIPGGAREMEHLLELKKADSTEHNLPFDGNYYLWDHRFYDRMMVEKEYSIDENVIAEYFPLRPTVGGMLKIFEELFGLVFVELSMEDRARISPTRKAEDIAWHEDVIIFSVWDDSGEGGGFVGYLYLDLHPRPGKYPHAANFNLQPGFLQSDGKSRRYPATALVCNFSKPTPKKPSLLKHDEVVTLFHELGHGIHDLAGRCRYARFHGTATVRDFVEAPSQMLENWCWTPSQLKVLSGHWETGENIPDHLIEKLVATKHVNDALFNLRQLHFGLFDMTVHTPKSHQEIEEMDMSKVYNDLRVQIAGLKGPEAQGEGRYGYPSSRSNTAPHTMCNSSIFFFIFFFLLMYKPATDIDAVTGATVRLLSDTSSAVTMQGTMAIYRLKSTPPTCSTRYFSRTPWIMFRVGGIGTPCLRGAAAKMRC